MTDYTKLIERLRKAARHDSVFGDDVREHASEQAAEAIEALQAECTEHKENAVRNARQAVAFRAERDQLQAENERLKKNNGIIYTEVLQLRNERDALAAELAGLKAQEPVGWIDDGGMLFWRDVPLPDGSDLFSAPKALAPLTDKQIYDMADADQHGGAMSFARAIEAAHGIGGTP